MSAFDEAFDASLFDADDDVVSASGSVSATITIVDLLDLRDTVARRLGDTAALIWSADEIDGYLEAAYLRMAQSLPIFWDAVYLDNLPAGFSFTAAWEADFVTFDYGLANYTIASERRLLTESSRRGPGHYTSPFEATLGYLTAAHADTTIPATAELPRSLTAIDRAVWDTRTMIALEPAQAQRQDFRYETNTGHVHGYVWRKDGIRTFRKVRVPAQQADCVTVTGSWGVLRRPTDVSADTVTGSFGVSRRIPSMHPIGASHWGLPRRPYLEGTNVRVEHFRHGRSLSDADGCELPAQYARYLRDYALAECWGRPSAGQDLALAQHFAQRWARNLARVASRLQRVDRERTSRMGGGSLTATRIPRGPQYPSSYGRVVR